MDDYEKARQINRSFDDYLIELLDFETMLGESVTPTNKMRTLKRGLHSELIKAILVHEGMEYDDFVSKASRIDQALPKSKKEKDSKEEKDRDSRGGRDGRDGKDGKDTRNTRTGNRPRRFDRNQRSSTSTSSSTTKPNIAELKPEIGYDEVREFGLFCHCKEKGHMRKDCPKLKKTGPQVNSVTININSSHPPQSHRDHHRLRTINKIRQGYTIKDARSYNARSYNARSYKDAILGRKPVPKLEAPSWSIKQDHQTIANSTSNSINTYRSSNLYQNWQNLSLPISPSTTPVLATLLILEPRTTSSLPLSPMSTNIKYRKLAEPIPIQQAVIGSKPKCNSIAKVNFTFGRSGQRSSVCISFTLPTTTLL
jgi:hypothetical protein